MTKTLTRAILENAGGAPEKSANSGNGGKIFVLPFFLEAMAAPLPPLKKRLALSNKPLTLGEEIDSSSSSDTLTNNHNSVNEKIAKFS